MPPVPKPNHKRRIPKQKDRNRFDAATIKAILERDENSCVRCGTMRNIETVPHHVQFRSLMGTGSKDNGVTICRTCHTLAHSKREVKEWFKEWTRLNLDENGDRKTEIPITPFLNISTK